MECRPGCGACCIAPSISTPIPGLPLGKPAGQACVQLDAQMQCRLFGHVDRPAVCGSLAPELAMCGTHRQQALSTLTRWERQTSPG
jgi:Fe-S-cluster containining protein